MHEQEAIDDGSFRYAEAIFVVEMMVFAAAAMMSKMASAWLMMRLTLTQPVATPVPPAVLQEDPPNAQGLGVDKLTQTTHTSRRDYATPPFKLLTENESGCWDL